MKDYSLPFNGVEYEDEFGNSWIIDDNTPEEDEPDEDNRPDFWKEDAGAED